MSTTMTTKEREETDDLIGRGRTTLVRWSQECRKLTGKGLEASKAGWLLRKTATYEQFV
jgi:hypothetical protein